MKYRKKFRKISYNNGISINTRQLAKIFFFDSKHSFLYLLVDITLSPKVESMQMLSTYIFFSLSGYLKQHQSGLFVPELPAEKVKVIDTLKFGSVDKIFLEFESPFWDLKDPGIMFLWSADEQVPTLQAFVISF